MFGFLLWVAVFLEFDDEVGGQGALRDDASEIEDPVSMLVFNRFGRDVGSHVPD